MTQKIGFFGGTLDPIHFGHINIAVEILEKRSLDEIWFCPTSINPFKLMNPPTSINHRMEMTHIAIKKIPQFKLIDIETKSNEPSYTIDTIRKLINESNLSGLDLNFFLIISEKEIPMLLKWKEIEELIGLAPPLIGSRSSTPLILQENHLISLSISQGWTQIPMFDISSTEIRRRLKLGLYCGHLLPRKVLDYISENKLYS